MDVEEYVSCSDETASENRQKTPGADNTLLDAVQPCLGGVRRLPARNRQRQQTRPRPVQQYAPC